MVLKNIYIKINIPCHMAPKTAQTNIIILYHQDHYIYKICRLMCRTHQFQEIN